MKDTYYKTDMFFMIQGLYRLRSQEVLTKSEDVRFAGSAIHHLNNNRVLSLGKEDFQAPDSVLTLDVAVGLEFCSGTITEANLEITPVSLKIVDPVVLKMFLEDEKKKKNYFGISKVEAGADYFRFSMDFSGWETNYRLAYNPRNQTKAPSGNQ